MKTFGDHFEDAAIALVTRAGLRVVARNFRCRRGEIDIIARDGHTLAFIEVRARTHHQYGGAASSVDLRKQRRIIATAQYFLKQHRIVDCGCRFDVIAFEPPQSRAPVEPRWIKSAFTI